MTRTKTRFILLLILLAVVLHLPTWSPMVTWAHHGEDGPELETAGRLLGVPHPTGYPLFMLLVRITSLVVPPPFSAAGVVSLLAAILAVVGVGMATRNLVRRHLGEGLPPEMSGLVAAALFATSLTWWRQTAIGEVYTLHLAIVAWVLALLFSNHPRRLILVAYLAGLGFAHHLQIVPFLFAVLAYCIWRRIRIDWRLVFLMAVPATLYAVLVLRSMENPRLDWGNPETWENLWWSLSGTPYQKNLFGDGLATTLERWVTAMTRGPVGQLGWGGAALAALGFAYLFRVARKEAGLLAVLFVGTSFVATAYAIPDPGAYYLPAVLAAAMASGIGGVVLWKVARTWSRDRMSPVIVAAAVCAMVGGIVAERIVGNVTLADARTELNGFEYALTGTRVLEPDALVISHGDGRTFSLWYGTEILEPRPDVAVLYDNLLGWDWYRDQVARTHPWISLPVKSLGRSAKRASLIERHIDSRPVYVTELEPELQGRFYVEAAGPLLRVRRRPLAIEAASSETRDSETRSR